jgi:8-oxo-dGTP pyrophosphatase MutT (NUDIX family)
MLKASEGGNGRLSGEEDRPQAAVALIVKGAPEPAVLLIKRADSERDPWSGHMALPGGRRDDDDETLLATAIRETIEEVGLDLGQQARLLGRLDAVGPASRKLPPLVVMPFVFGTIDGARAYVASPEVAEVFWVPVRELSSADVRSTVEIPLPGGTREFPCYRVAGQVVWGLTYRMLEQFLEVYPEGELEQSPEQ